MNYNFEEFIATIDGQARYYKVQNTLQRDKS